MKHLVFISFAESVVFKEPEKRGVLHAVYIYFPHILSSLKFSDTSQVYDIYNLFKYGEFLKDYHEWLSNPVVKVLNLSYFITCM